MISFDTELTGLDLYHGCLPYSMQLCNDKGQAWYFSWPVDPYTRIPAIDSRDLKEVGDLLCSDEIVLHNASIDLLAFEKACEHCQTPWQLTWQWEHIQDTLIKSHALRNLWSHSLKDLREVFFGVSRFNQDQLKQATHQARRICRTKAFIDAHGHWRIADTQDPHWPGVKRAPKEKEEDIEGWWLMDTWLPAEIVARAPEFLPPETDCIPQFTPSDPTATADYNFFLHPWESISQTYAMEDPLTTLVLNEVLDEALEAEGLTKISQQRHKTLRTLYRMSQRGVHILGKKMRCEAYRYHTLAYQQYQDVCTIAAANGLPEFNPNSDPQTRELLFEKWKLPVLERTPPSDRFPEGQPRTTAGVLESLDRLLDESPPSSIGPKKAREIKRFLKSQLNQGRNDKAADTLSSYLNWSVSPVSFGGLYLHPKFNTTGTRFTRQSCNDPNLMNVGTGKDVYDDNGDKTGELEFLLRNCFGPPPGKEWLSIDFQSIEFLIWGFSCGSQVIREVYHAGLPLFKPFMEAIHGFFDKDTKEYKRTKNGIYAKLYGASGAKADNTFGKEGASKAIEERIPEVRSFTKRLHALLLSQGYITTLGGYRLYVESNEPHKVVSAFVQGHAGWVIGEAMVACEDYLQDFPDVHIILQIHDELIFEGPVGFHQQHAVPLGKIMTAAGEKYEIPTPVNRSLITENWGSAKVLLNEGCTF